DDLCVTATHDYAVGAAQPNIAAALAGAEACAGDGDLRAGCRGRWRHTGDVRCAYSQVHGVGPDATLQHLSNASLRTRSYVRDDLRVVPTDDHTVGAPQPDTAAALAGAEA